MEAHFFLEELHFIFLLEAFFGVMEAVSFNLFPARRVIFEFFIFTFEVFFFVFVFPDFDLLVTVYVFFAVEAIFTFFTATLPPGEELTEEDAVWFVELLAGSEVTGVWDGV